MSLEDKAAAAAAPAEGAAPAAADGEKKLSKNQLKKLAKGKGKKKKEKPQWNQPGEGKKKDDKKTKLSLPKPEFVNTTPKGEKKDLSKTPHGRCLPSPSCRGGMAGLVGGIWILFV